MIEMTKKNRCTGKFCPINFVLMQESSVADPGPLMLMRRSRKFCQKGPTLTGFFVFVFLVDEGREDPKTADNHHLNDVSLAYP